MFLNSNNTNLKEIKVFDKKQEKETPLEQMQLQQHILVEEKNMEEEYLRQKNKITTQNSAPTLGTMRSKFNQSAQLYSHQSSIEKILRQVNQDKCNYSKLRSFEFNDIKFIEQYLQKAYKFQNSEAMALPNSEFEQMNKKKQMEKKRNTVKHF